MNDEIIVPPPRLYAHLLSVLFVPLLTAGVAALSLAGTDATHEAIRIALYDKPEQLPGIAVGLYLACVAARMGAETALMFGSPRLWDSAERRGSIARIIPRFLPVALSLTLALAVFFLEPSSSLAAATSVTFLLIGLIVAAVGPTIVTQSSEGRPYSAVAAAVAIAGVALGLLATFFQVQTSVPEDLGPVSVLLLWVFCATVLFTPLAALGSRLRVPILLAVLTWAMVLSSADYNDNHIIRGYSDDTASLADRVVDTERFGEEPSLASWLSKRTDADAYERYPVFIVTTEGGGMRAAYYTAGLLSALQDQCPAFAEHVFAISGVSGGSLGAAAYAAMVADAPEIPKRNPGCFLGVTADSQTYRNRARRVFSADLLSPTIAATLFPDAFQRVVPVALPSFDRARALELAFERSWQKAQPNRRAPNLLAEPMSRLFAGANKDRVPHLVLLTTQVGTGDLVPFSTMGPIVLGNRSTNRQAADQLAGASAIRLGFVNTAAVPLSTAAVLSARFPYITPAGSLPAQFLITERESSRSEGKLVRLVDGGYFENSGTWFANGLLQKLLGEKFDAANKESAAFKEIYQYDEPLRQRVLRAQIVVLVLHSTPCVILTARGEREPRCSNAAASFPDEGWNELMSPLRTLLNTRDSRAMYAEADLRRTTAMIHQLCGLDVDSGRCLKSLMIDPPLDTKDQRDMTGASVGHIVGRVQMSFVNPPSVDIPLSWVLSERSRLAIDEAIDNAVGREARQPSNNRTAVFESEMLGIFGDMGGVLCALAQRTGADYIDPKDEKRQAGLCPISLIPHDISVSRGRRN